MLVERGSHPETSAMAYFRGEEKNCRAMFQVADSLSSSFLVLSLSFTHWDICRVKP